MNLERHIAAIIRRHPNQADYCAERIVKLVEKNFTSTNSDYAAALYKWRDEHIDKLSTPAWCAFNSIVERLHSEIPNVT